MKKILFLPVAALVVAACAGPVPKLAPGTDEVQVRAALGPPALVLKDPSGGSHLAYPNGPLGLTTHMARIGPDGKLVLLEQVLDEDHFSRLKRGETTEAEVLRLLGPPAKRMEFPRLGQVAWDYRFMDAWGYLAEHSVMIDGRGVYVGSVTKRLNDGRSDTK